MYAWQATVQDNAGNALPLPVVTVYESDGITLAAIYNESGAGLPNPLTGTATGFVQFWAEAGQYKIEGAAAGNETEVWAVTIDAPALRAEMAADEAEAYAQAAALSAIDAEAAADNAASGVNVYPDTAAGLAATSVGEQFAVVVGEDIIRYRHDAGPVATEVASYPSSLKVDNLADKVPSFEAQAKFIPVIHNNESVAIWLEDGDIAAKGMASGLRKSAVSDVISFGDAGHIIPLITSNSNVIMWLDESGIKGPGIINPETVAPRMSPKNSSLPIMTDGRGMARLRARVGQVRAGVTGSKAKLALTGDSWTDLATIPQALSDMLDGEFTISGGWRTSIAGIAWQSGTWALSGGWTQVDGSSPSVTSYTYAPGPDGNLIYTNATDQTISWSGVTATDFKIWSRAHGGTWRYRVDGGAWTVVSELNDSSLNLTNISGLADTTHTIEIDTTGNAGTVVIDGAYFTRSGVIGVEILKMGNGGTNGIQTSLYAPYAEQFVSEIGIDAVVHILGTNDYRQSASSVATYMAGQEAMRDAWSAGVPDISMVFVAPSQSDGTVITPLTSLRDALYYWCVDQGHEFYNMYDDWLPYAESDDLGQWTDALHISSSGANAMTRRLNEIFGI